jgi:hypothetical protein
MISFCDCRQLISNFKALAAMYMRSTSIGDRKIFHRDVAFALKVVEQMIATKPEDPARSPGAKSAVNQPKPDGLLATKAASQIEFAAICIRNSREGQESAAGDRFPDDRGPAARRSRRFSSEFDLLRNPERIFNIDPEIANGAF